MADRRVRRFTRAVWIVLVGTALVALASHPAAADSDPPTGDPSSPIGAPAPAQAARTADDWTRPHPGDVVADAGTFTVTPSTGLGYRTTVVVDASGYPPGSLFGAIECVAGATAIEHCAGTTLVIGTTDDAGAFRRSTRVHRFIVTPDGTTDCAVAPGTCVMAGGPTFGEALLTTHPLTFDPTAPIPPAPEIHASPDSGLGLVTELTVTGSGFDPDGIAGIRQCVVRAESFDDCGVSEYGFAEVDASGRFTTTMVVRRGIRTADDPVVDCAVAPGCELVGFDPADPTDPTRLARARVTFDPSVPRPPPPAVVIDPSTGLADRQLVTVSATGFAPGELVYLGQCAARSVGLPTCGTVETREADRLGAVSLTFRVRRFIGTPEIDCQSAPGVCVAFAASTDDAFAAASVPLTFDPDAPPIPPPAIAVAPTVDLHDGQSVVVTGSGFAPGEQVALVQCRAGAPDDTGQSCDLPATLVYRTADASGSVRTTFTVRQVLQTQRFGEVDCARDEPGCIIGWAGLSDVESERGQIAIRFGSADGGGPPSPPPTPGAEPPPAPPAAAGGAALAATGTDPRFTAGLGLALALVGAGCLVVASRARRSGSR